MKLSRLILGLTVVCLLLLAVACGSQGAPEPPVIETPAGEMNFTVADLGPDWTLQADQGLDKMPDFSQPHIRDVSMRMFGAEKVTGLVISIVISTKTVASAEKEMAGDAVQGLGKNLQEQLPDVTLGPLTPPDLGDEAVMVGGSHADLGLNIYMVTFRKANVITMFSLIGSEESVTEAVARDYAGELEARIH